MTFSALFHALTDKMRTAGVDGRMVIYLEHPRDGSHFIDALYKEIGENAPTHQVINPDDDGEHESVEFYGVKIRWPKRA